MASLESPSRHRRHTQSATTELVIQRLRPSTTNPSEVLAAIVFNAVGERSLDRLDVEVALLLCYWFDRAVLD